MIIIITLTILTGLSADDGGCLRLSAFSTTRFSSSKHWVWFCEPKNCLAEPNPIFFFENLIWFYTLTLFQSTYSFIESNGNMLFYIIYTVYHTLNNQSVYND